MELRILERWTQKVRPPEEKWFLDYVVRAPQHAGRHLTASWYAYRALAELGFRVDSAFEFFGGMGAHSLMIQELWSPRFHSVIDNSAEAVAHIEEHVPAVSVWQGDAYDPTYQHGSDVVGVDCGDATVFRTREGEPVRGLLDRVFCENPKGVVFTDIACRYLHLHRERYEALLGPGTCVDYPTYLEALADRLEALYGYTMVGGYWSRWSAVMAFAQEGERRRFVPVPDSPVGLEVTA